MAQLKDLLVNSVAKFLSKVYVSDSVTAPTFIGKLQGNADTATKATSATKADSATTATTANKATLASGVENSGTVSDGVARHVWFSNASDEAKRVSSDNFKYTPKSQMLTTNVSGNAGSATKLQSIRKVDGVNFDGSADITHYGTCSTAAATAAKTVTLSGFNLATGAKVAVKFTVTNTAANPTLNVNGTGAKSIKYRGAAISTDALAANRIYEFIYDGTDYVFVGDINTDTNTTYGNMTGASTSAAGKAGLVPAPVAGAATRYLRSDGTWQVPPDTTYNDATTSTHGLMSTSDKSKLDGIASGANKTTVDSALSDSSTNPVQNKVIVSALSGKASNTLLTNENLNSVTTPGFYNASGGNTCTNKPANVDEFGLEVIHTAGGNYYVQILYRKDLSYRRTCVNGTWSAWTTDKLTDTTYSDATQSAHGLMSTTDKKKLDGIAEGANKITVDSAMSSSSTNPVQNKIVQAALDTKAAKDKGALFVVGTHTATTNAWTGKLSGVSALYDGLLIDYWVPYTGTSAGDTLNLTLDDGTTTGAKNMYYRGTSRLTTHYSTGYVIRLVYRTAAVINGTTYSGWWNVSSFDSTNTTDISLGNGQIYAGTNGIWRYTLVALDSTGKWQSFVTSSSTGTSKTINTSAKFRLPATIYYYGANNDATNGNLVPSTYSVWQIRCVADLRYSTNCTTTQFTANAPIYLECTLSSDRYFQVTSTCITQTFTKGKYYIYLGNTYSAAYQLCLTSQHPVYYYDGTNLIDYVYSLLDNKSDIGHTHNYAGSSSAGGTANSAAKLATARTISANDDYVMNFNFDGSGNVSTQLRAYNATANSGNKLNYPYHRFAKIDATTNNYYDAVTNILITQDFNGGGWGICRIVLRTNNQSNTLSSASVDWLVRCGLAADSVQIGLYTKDGSTYADAFFKVPGTHGGTVFRNLGSGGRGSITRRWAFINSIEVDNTTETDKKTSYEVYTSVADAGTKLHNQAYTTTIAGVDVGTVKYANTSGSATSATSAEKATKDSANQQINTTYIKGISANGKTITVTKGDNTTSTFTTQDTTYGTATASANGLMSSTDKSKLDGITAGATKVTVDSALSSTSTNPVQNKVINTALASKADVTSKSFNTLKAEASNTSLVVPDENAIASSPFARDLWHDHFAFLNSHTIQDSQTSTDGTTWTTSTTDLKNLFAQKEYVNTIILTKDIKARRFVLYSNDFSWSSISWYEFGVAYTDPFSNFNILIETSADDKKTWTTVANVTVQSHSNPHFIKASPINGNKYIRFTFTKTTNVTTGAVNLTCIKGLTKRKGDQGRGIEYESPYNWNYNRDIYPWVDNIQNLGSSAKKWKNVYATTFTGALSGNASTATKATQDSAGQQINTTYIKGLSASKGVVTYTKGNNSTGTINTQDNFVTLTQAEYNSLASAGKLDENSYYFVTDSANGPKLIQYVTFTASGWTASSDGTYYTQSVTASKITAYDEPMIIKNLPYSTGATEAKAYNKAFGILCSGIGETADSKINLKVFKKPTTDISVGLIKIVS